MGLLEEVHEFALSLSQVESVLLVAVAEGLTLLLGQPLVGVHDFETHLFCEVALGGISITLFVFNNIARKFSKTISLLIKSA